jgi:hypothetical protein
MEKTQAPPLGSVAGRADAPLVHAICEIVKSDDPEGVTEASERFSCPRLETVNGTVPDCPPKPRVPAEKYATGPPRASKGGVAATTGVSTVVMVSVTDTETPVDSGILSRRAMDCLLFPVSIAQGPENLRGRGNVDHTLR